MATDLLAALSEAERAILTRELEILEQTRAVLRSELKDTTKSFDLERTRAQELTATFVTTKRVEDKMQLSSDEAVAHARSKAKKEEVATIEQLLEAPYFARVEFVEGDKLTEFKVSTFANAAARIIDWRHAPVAKLFYEYREGDSFDEVIMNRQREGTITLRRTVEISGGILRKVTTPTVTIYRGSDGLWQATTTSAGTRAQSGQELLSLISAEQFAAITEQADTGVIVQGLAGSGKTTVGLHRVSWLIRERSLDQTQVLCLAPTEALRTFIQSSLASMNLHAVATHTWASLYGKLVAGRNEAVPVEATPTSVRRLLHSAALVRVIMHLPAAHCLPTLEFLASLFANPRTILERDPTRLISASLVSDTHQFLREALTQGTLPGGALAALLLLAQRQRPATMKHLMVDEAQNISPVELAVSLSLVAHPHELTLVGDKFQRLVEGSFPSWQAVREALGIPAHESKLVSLSVSYRSTKQIMTTACAVVGEPAPTFGRTGRAPLWVMASSDNRGIAGLIQWLTTATTAHPAESVAVVVADKKDVSLVASYLEPTFGNLVRETLSFSAGPGITILPIDECGGMEYFSVACFGSHKIAPDDSPESSKRLYLAITRAVEHAALISWREVPWLTKVTQSLRVVRT